MHLLSQFPRLQLGHLPTPLEHLPRLSKHLGGPEIYVKRDDCTGLGTGGNKTRKLEFLLADAIKRKATAVITPGALQSNHARQTAAAACKLGLRCDLILERRAAVMPPAYQHSGNVLLDQIFGAHIHEVDHGCDIDLVTRQIARELQSKGERPYVIPMGGSNPIGALGYVRCALELLEQIKRAEITVSHIVHATGSAGTQAGLLVGLSEERSALSLLGIGVSARQQEQEDKVYQLAVQTAELLDRPDLVRRADVVANCDYVGEGYGMPTPEMNAAVLLLARLEGLVCDPVYSGKALAGMIDMIRNGPLAEAAGVVFLHTGGVAGLFGYVDQLDTEN